MIYKLIARSSFQLCYITRQLAVSEKRFYYSPHNFPETAGINADKGLNEQYENASSFHSKRNKSGLKPYHFHLQHGQIPLLDEDEMEVMALEKYRRLFGRFGSEANIDMKALWPSVKEMELLKEIEKIEYPHTVQEMISMAKTQRLEEEKALNDRQEKLKANLMKLSKWKKDMAARLEKKEKEAKEALECRQKQIEEVREVLGYRISPHDPQFAEILEKKVEEDKKKAKKAKKLLKQQKLLDEITVAAKRDAIAPDQQDKGGQPESLYGKKIE